MSLLDRGCGIDLGTCVVHSEVDVAHGGELGVVARVHGIVHNLCGG